ncbi:hypothetical protein LWI29_033207 [Acer saccharum]|uniref:Uncharacterized protein n=1 Tax=Acer saccharum TaxID=4024 RepID=A0AA39W5X6_ACESA|nr:hypothetical protein LWI29_033207 [Acer saccharum]
MDKRRMEREIHRANTSFNIFRVKSARIEDQICLLFATGYRSLDIQILSCGCFLAVEILLRPGSTTFENTQKKFFDVKRLTLQVRESLEELQSKVDKSRLALIGVLIEFEKERLSLQSATTCSATGVQRIIESCHCKCPVCAASFGPNDVKPCISD